MRIEEEMNSGVTDRDQRREKGASKGERGIFWDTFCESNRTSVWVVHYDTIFTYISEGVG